MWPGKCGGTYHRQSPKPKLLLHVCYDQSCCDVFSLCLHFRVKTTLAVLVPGPQHISLATVNIRDIFLNFLIHRYSTSVLSISILVEIQKYYRQLSRWFYTKLLQTIKASGGRQTEDTTSITMLVSLKGGICFFEAREPTALKQQQTHLFLSLPYMYSHRKHCNISWSSRLSPFRQFNYQTNWTEHWTDLSQLEAPWLSFIYNYFWVFQGYALSFYCLNVVLNQVIINYNKPFSTVQLLIPESWHKLIQSSSV